MDIVEVLRDYADDRDLSAPSRVLLEAADEITRLRAELADVKFPVPVIGSGKTQLLFVGGRVFTKIGGEFVEIGGGGGQTDGDVHKGGLK